MSMSERLSPKQAAPIIAGLTGRTVTVKTVHNLVARGRLLAIHEGRRVWLTRTALNDFVAAWEGRARGSKLRPVLTAGRAWRLLQDREHGLRVDLGEAGE